MNFKQKIQFKFERELAPKPETTKYQLSKESILKAGVIQILSAQKHHFFNPLKEIKK